MAQWSKRFFSSRHQLWWLCLALAGCGFHLRSYNMESSVESYAVIGKTRSSVVAPLHRALQAAGVKQTGQADATVVVDLLDQRSERRTASSAGRARATEYETIYAIHYRILDSSGRELAAPAWIERERIYRVDRTSIVGTSEEQELLERELIQDVAGQIMRAMDAVSRSLPAAHAS